MNNQIYRNGVVYSNTTVKIPLDLKMRAQKHGINISKTVTEALTAKVLEVE